MRTCAGGPNIPKPDCQFCSRLAEYRHKNRLSEPTWHNGPVTSFGPLNARLLVVGLAPGLKGANRTGRPFTGDFAGDLLYPTLQKVGFVLGDYGQSTNDCMKPQNCRITNAVRCVPPQNRPTTHEIKQCNSFLKSEIFAMTKLKIILALGHIAHNAVLRALDIKLSGHPFQHGTVYKLDKKYKLADSYHCSRYNTNTGRLTEEMFQTTLNKIRQLIEF